MKKVLKSNLKLLTVFFAIFMVSCSTDEGSVFDTGNQQPENGEEEEEETVATLMFSEANSATDIVTAAAVGQAGSTVPGRVIFTSTDLTQRRMYITQNISGAGDLPFNDFALSSSDLNKVLKADGSIDLDGATKKEIDFTFDLPAPTIADGNIVYHFWTTTGKGDFRDPIKRKALGHGTITVTVGTGNNPAAEVRTFSGVKLFAPAQDGNTESFFSLLDEKVYRIDAGPEFRAFWDFGYYYGASGVSADDMASFASTSTYDASFGFAVQGLEPDAGEDDMANETLNQAFFALSISIDAAGFDGIALSGDLNSIIMPTSEKITNLTVDDVIEFEDNYGKKGLIKITAIQAGFDNNDFIEFDVKIQP